MKYLITILFVCFLGCNKENVIEHKFKFQVGDLVTHTTNPDLKMSVIDRNEQTYQYELDDTFVCRFYVNPADRQQIGRFLGSPSFRDYSFTTYTFKGFELNRAKP